MGIFSALISCMQDQLREALSQARALDLPEDECRRACMASIHSCSIQAFVLLACRCSEARVLKRS